MEIRVVVETALKVYKRFVSSIRWGPMNDWRQNRRTGQLYRKLIRVE